MQTARSIHTLLLPIAVASVSAHAAPTEGESGSYAALILVLLGIWALLAGVRNLRALRYSPIVPRRQSTREPAESAESTE